MLLDPTLSWDSQIVTMSRLAFNQFRLIALLCPYLDKVAFRMFMHCSSWSRINYCNTIYLGFTLRLIKRLQSVQNVVARLLAGVSAFDHQSCTGYLWHPRFKILMVTYKAFHCLGPRYLSECLFPGSSTSIARSSQAMIFQLAQRRPENRQGEVRPSQRLHQLCRIGSQLSCPWSSPFPLLRGYSKHYSWDLNTASTEFSLPCALPLLVCIFCAVCGLMSLNFIGFFSSLILSFLLSFSFPLLCC